MKVEPAGKGGGDLLEHRPAALIPFHRHHMRRTVFKQRAGEPAGPGTDLNHRALAKIAGGAGDAPGQIEIEKKVLSQAAPGRQSVAGNDVAQRRERSRSGRGLRVGSSHQPRISTKDVRLRSRSKPLAIRSNRSRVSWLRISSSVGPLAERLRAQTT